MAKYMVTFMPVNRSTMVDEGTTLAEAARQADVFIKNLCGGEGVCGQCRVQIVSGQAEADEQAKAFNADTRTMGISNAKAIPLAVAMPTRKAVYRPGPAVTARQDTASRSIFNASNKASSIARTFVECGSSPW